MKFQVQLRRLDTFYLLSFSPFKFPTIIYLVLFHFRFIFHGALCRIHYTQSSLIFDLELWLFITERAIPAAVDDPRDWNVLLSFERNTSTAYDQFFFFVGTPVPLSQQICKGLFVLRHSVPLLFESF